MPEDKDLNDLGDKQSAFAGTNTNRYGPTGEIDPQSIKANPEEAQDVAYDGERLSGEEAEKAVNKANQNRS